MKIFVILLLAIILNSCAEQNKFPAGRWIDLSYEYSSETIYWPTADGFKLDTVFAGITDKGFFYTANNFCSAEHGGTHIDAPIHFSKGKRTVDQLPVDQLIGEAIVIDVSEKSLNNRDYQVSSDDFIQWEKMHYKIPENIIVFLKTGYGQFYPDRIKYMGTEERGSEAVAKLHFPGLHPDAAKWLVQNRKIKAIGLDTPSIDYGQSQLFESHQILFAENIPALENVANLEQLPETGAYVLALPIKIKGGSGGPCRIVALLPN